MTDWAKVKKEREQWRNFEPQYFYVQPEIVEKAAEDNSSRHHGRLVLETDYPGIFRVGDLTDFSDVTAEDLNGCLSEMMETERQKAMTVCGFLMTNPEAVEEKLIPLRMEAIEIFSKMEETEPTLMSELNAAFYSLTEEERQIRYAFSLQNPWMLTFLQIPQTFGEEAALTHKSAIAALDHIKICATINDADWLASPVYPTAGTYNKGMKHTIGSSTPGGKAARGKDGRKYRRQTNIIYHEPALAITDIVPVPRFYFYRDYLPREWLEPISEQEKEKAETARKEAERCLEGLNDGKHIPCSLKKRKNRS